MPLSPGEKLGPYEILASIGAGGMGEVYKARDTRLDRIVAIKVLPEHIAKREDLRARFEREARAVASLKHPNICVLHDIGSQDGAGYMVMEYMEGETLASRIEKGALPLDQALKFATQIADALDRAHRAGVTHRDVKPQNIMLTRDGVKVLDFGLAKSSSKPGPTEETLTAVLTTEGTVMGTPQYMAPEQFEGKEADARSDIWAFGAVLYEMMTGQKAFQGKSYSSLLGAILSAEPAPMSVKPFTPAWLERLVRRCLAKDPEDRWQTMRDVVIELQTPPPESAAAEPSKAARAPWALAGLAGALAIALAAVSFVHLRETPPPAPEVVRFPIPLPDKVTGQFPSISPDGRRVAFRAAGEGGSLLLWVHSFDSLETKPLAGTEASGNGTIWSYDSHSIVFAAQGKLKRMDASGGPAQTLCNISGPLAGGFWTRDNRIIFSPINGPLSEVPASGGNPSPVTLGAPGDTTHSATSLLPDGKHFVYLRRGKEAGIYVGSLDAKPEQQKSKRLLLDDSIAYYAPPLNTLAGDSGHLLFVRGNTLVAQPFDASRLELTGDTVALVEQVASLGGFSVSPTGALVYGFGDGGDRQLAWFDRQGRPLGSEFTPGFYREIELSPDGTRVTLARNLSQNRDIWVYEFARRAPTKLTSDPALDVFPVWSPDGKRIVFSFNRGGANQLFVKAADGAGSEAVLLKCEGELTVIPRSWSRDGRFLLYEPGNLKTGRDLWVLPFEGGVAGKPTVFLNSEFDETQGQFSPDSRFVAYVSTESSGPEVYVSTFPDPKGGKWNISSGGGSQPRWRRDGRELLYMTADGKLMSVDVTLGASFKPSAPKVLFQAPVPGSVSTAQATWDIYPDGQKFLINTVAGQSAAPLTVVLNWQAGLKK